MTELRRVMPQGLAAQFSLLLLAALISANLIAAFLLAREGSYFDRLVRVERDMGRLVALVATLEQEDAETGLSVMQITGTGYTRFSVGVAPIMAEDATALPDIAAVVAQALPGHALHVTIGNPAETHDDRVPLMIISVQLNDGVQAGRWLNSLVYPLTPAGAWWQKNGFFVPLLVSLSGSLLVGLLFIRRMTRPLSALAAAADAAGRGDRSARVPEAGARELREAAAAFNDMQQRIADFDRTRQRLLADISHDLRTPITSLRMRAELLEDDSARAPMVRILDDMAVMTDDLLRYAKGIWQGEAAVDTDLCALLQVLAAERGAGLRAVPLRLILRPVAMTRAIGNLVDNAQRYGGSARVTLDRQGGDAVIAVEDDGPGIPDDMLEAVMAPFMRGDHSRSRDTGGTGLGLAIARAIVEGHGGTLKLANRRGGGLRAEIRLRAPARA